MAKRIWRNLEHQLAPRVREALGAKSRIWLGFSGGGDSVLLADVLNRLQGPLRFELELLHVHHGSEVKSSLRDQMAEFAVRWSERHKLPIRVVRHEPGALQGELACREFRWKVFREGVSSDEILALAHHAQDLLETRLLRLWRGTGAQGLQSMSILRGRVFRPMLDIGKRQIQRELHQRQLEFFQDPENENLAMDRNWIRHVLLKSLDQRRPGSVHALARSLDLILRELPAQKFEPSRALDLSNTPPARKSAVLSLWMQGLGARNLSQSRVEEVLKCLHSERPVHRTVAGLQIVINAQQVRLL